MITPQKMNKHDPIKRHLKISLGAVHIVRTQQGGEGGSTKSVQMRAWGGGVFGAFSAHAKSLQNTLDTFEVLGSPISTFLKKVSF